MINKIFLNNPATDYLSRKADHEIYFFASFHTFVVTKQYERIRIWFAYIYKITEHKVICRKIS